MQRPREIIVWILAGIAGAMLLVWAFPRAYPVRPVEWKINRAEATEIALERFRDLGDPIPDAYVVTALNTEATLERRLQLSLPTVGLDKVRQSWLAKRAVEWIVTAYPSGALPQEWTYRARLSPSGEVTSLRLRVDAQEDRPSIVEAAARAVADAFLTEQGFDLEELLEPEVRTQELLARTDLTLRYRYRELVFGEELPYGVEVFFAGDRLAGFAGWFEDPRAEELQGPIQRSGLISLARILLVYLLVPVVAFFFLRRYHAGEIGVRRGVQIFLLVMAVATVLVALSTQGTTEGFVLGPFSRQQTTWVWGAQILIIYFSAIALCAFLSWSVGESCCRERLGAKLAAFDALFQLQWGNATVAASTLRGVAAGILLTAVTVSATLTLKAFGGWTHFAFLFGPWWENAAWPGITLLCCVVAFGLYAELFARLLLLPPAVERFGPWLGGIMVTLFSAAVFFPIIEVLPVSRGVPFWILGAGVPVILFLRFDLLTAILASLTASLLLQSYPMLIAQDPFLQLQGWLALALVVSPLVVSARFLGGAKRFVYRYEDVPPHVRRIAERERQRVELETARRIQSSILPELPEQLAGVQIAHAYLPATEVGGDFYDVLALEDGRLAVAVGDVAGHGVSSGLVMSMAKSALAVQVSFRPEVEAVFQTLNRMVFQSARKRLLTTLCYALLDPQRRQLQYASAGHLFPYRVSGAGRVVALESIAYPLGVRSELVVEPRSAQLEAGDSLFLFSDGVVEARPEGGDELFGFQRLEASLARHGDLDPCGLRDAVLADINAYTGIQPREDDLTVLVLRIP